MASGQPSLDSYLYAKAETAVDAKLMHQMREQDQVPNPVDRALPRFTLVVGPSPFTMPRGWEYYLATPYEGASYIATTLFNAGYQVRIVDVRYEIDPLRAAAAEVLKDTDVVGICTFEDNFPFVRELIAAVKTAAPQLPIICGGSLVTSVPSVFMNHTQADVAVISEGELTILELMDSFARGAWAKELPNIRGIWYRAEGGRPEKTPPRGQMQTLDFLPRMRLELWPQANGPQGLQPQIITSFSRGCRNDCAFCYRTTPQVSFKSIRKFDEEMRWFKDRYHIDFVFFADLTFNAEKQRTLDICDVLKQYDVKWTCLTRCAEVDVPQLTAMYQSGCDIALFGVESLGATALKAVRKPTTENISMRAMHYCHETGVRFGGLLIVGLPGETEESLQHMVAWAEEHHNVTRVKYLASLPGTSVYRRGIESGLLRSELDHLNWLSIEQSMYEDEFFNVSGLPEAVIREAYKRIYDSYMPGPVMDFKHYPDHFLYLSPNPDDGLPSSVAYAGKGWRAHYSSAGPHLAPGSERYTFDKIGGGRAAIEASLVECGAKRLEKAGAPE